MKRWACFSPCGAYRLVLGREPDDGWQLGTVAFILNNPSIADAHNDDPTVRRGWGFAQYWGYDRMIFINVNPCCSTDPKLAHIPAEDVMRRNDSVLRAWATQADMVVAAWGTAADKALVQRAIDVLLPVRALHILEVCKDGTPKHPLYLKGDLVPLFWKGAKRVH